MGRLRGRSHARPRLCAFVSPFRDIWMRKRGISEINALQIELGRDRCFRKSDLSPNAQKGIQLDVRLEILGFCEGRNPRFARLPRGGNKLYFSAFGCSEQVKKCNLPTTPP